MYIIKVNDYTKKDHCWVGYSNSTYTSGFYLAAELHSAVFIKELNEMPKLLAWLESRNCTYNIVEIAEKGHRRIYHGH